MLNKLACGLLIASATAGACAQTDVQVDPASTAYLTDTRGVVVRSQTGLCWRSAHWTPADAVAGCDGELVPPITKPTAPAIVPPAALAEASAAVPAAPKRCDFAVTLDSDQTFGFDKAVLSSAAKQRMDEEVLSRIASCAKVDVVLVTGHTDRLGVDQYNQKLSEKRADMVAAYLKSKGVSGQVNTLGVGKTQPLQACEGRMQRAQLIECLAPNRRVTIEVRGAGK